jgi:peptide/nickel transport system permease protein/oligopeptide transport system permease protein
MQMLRHALRRLLAALVVLVVISYLSFLAQDLSLRARTHRAAPAGEVLWEAARQTGELWANLARGDLGSVVVERGQWRVRRAEQFGELLGAYFVRSLALLLLAMALGGLIGGVVGLLAAGWRRKGVAFTLLMLSIVGISTPSFFLGTLLQWGEIALYRATGLQLLPVGGFGWDAHLVLPVLVLAARPIAQVTRLSYAQFSTIFGADYVRTAHAKGLRAAVVWLRHITPNGATTVLTAMGTSLRFSLSSLPVVEYMFGWPGVGKALLDTINATQMGAATLLLLSMGALFVVVNLVLDVAYRLIDPRLRAAEQQMRPRESWRDWLGGLLADLGSAVSLRRWRERAVALLEARARAQGGGEQPADRAEARAEDRAEKRADERASDRSEVVALRGGRRREWLAALLANPSLVIGAALALLLVVVVVFGPALAPYRVVGTDPDYYFPGTEVRPPLPPGERFSLGTDVQGRDILSLLLVGARRTLGIALLAVLARILIGSLLGFLAGWFAGSAVDRTLMGIAEALSAFPALLLAMLVVYAIGIRQGLSAFVIALAFVGWSEVMQTVRAQVLSIKPMDYIEGAVATGLREGQILSAHVLPNVWPTIISLGFLEMGGVLMLLGELGFLGVFIGGGLAAGGDGVPTLVYYDVPEWSVMLANSWRGFRSYPWTMIYPALAFFVAILAFTFVGEGLRWLSERLTLSFGSLFNRYTLAGALVLSLAVWGVFNEASFYSQHKSRALAFDGQRALQDVATLAGEQFNGRRSGTPDADLAAAWLVDEFKALGLQYAGQATQDYTQTTVGQYRDLTAMPSLVLTAPDGRQIAATLNQDYWRYASEHDVGGVGAGDVVIASDGGGYMVNPDVAAYRYGITVEELLSPGRILLEPLPELSSTGWYLAYSGRLLAAQGQPSARFELLAQTPRTTSEVAPVVQLSNELIAAMLAETGHTLAELRAKLEAGTPFYLDTGWHAELSLPNEHRTGVSGVNVLGYWPGEDVELDAEAIIVAAHYDGLGRLPDGTLYPGANDNASGVATMLEIVRSLQEQGFRPKRSLIFVAYTDGERHRAMDWNKFMQARLGFDEFKVVAAIQLGGVGAGTGDQAVVWLSSRERLTQVFERAARKVGTPMSTRAAGLHADPTIWPRASDAVPAVAVSWAGADDVSHLPTDTVENIDMRKLQDVGEMTSLAIMVLATDPAY